MLNKFYIKSQSVKPTVFTLENQFIDKYLASIVSFLACLLKYVLIHCHCIHKDIKMDINLRKCLV